MKKTASYSQFRSKVLAVFMAALMSSFSLTPLALADEVASPEAEGEAAPGLAAEGMSGEENLNGEIFDGKIRLTVTLPTKSFVYDGQQHSIFDDETTSQTSEPQQKTQISQDVDSATTEAGSVTPEAPSDELESAEQPQNTVEGLDVTGGESDDVAAPEVVATEGADQDEAEGEAIDDGKGAAPASEDEAPEAEIASDATETADITAENNTTPEVVPSYPVLTMTSPDEFGFTFDGETYTVTGLTVMDVVATDIGTTEYAATGTPQIITSEGVDVSENFDLEILPGALTIEQRSLVLVSDSLMKTYEPGVALVDESGKVAVEGDGFLPGDGAHYTFTGSQEEVGATLNTFTYEFDEGTNADVYKVTEKPGTLRVTNFQFDGVIPYTIEAVTETLPYDGQDHYLIDFATATFTLDGEADEFTVCGAEDMAEVATDIGEYTFEPVGPFTVIDSFGNDVSQWFDITWQPVTVAIEPRAMYLKVNDYTKLYGEEDPAFTYQFLATESDQTYSETLIDADDLGEITLSREEGEALGDYAIVVDYTENDNYEVTVEEGTLTIEASKLDVNVESVHVTYDGKPHSVTVVCDLPDVTVLYKTPESEWSEENPAYTEIGTYPVYVQILPAEGNEGNTASDVIEAQVEIVSDDPAAENPDGSQDDILTDDASNAEATEPQGPASPEEDPDYAEPPAETPTNAATAQDLSVPDDIPSVDVNDLTLPETAETDISANDLSVPENELADETAPDSELLATTSSDDAVGANSVNQAQKSETVPMTVAENSTNPFGGIFGIVAVGIIVLALCGIGAAIYLWRTKESDE